MGRQLGVELLHLNRNACAALALTLTVFSSAGIAEQAADATAGPATEKPEVEVAKNQPLSEELSEVEQRQQGVTTCVPAIAASVVVPKLTEVILRIEETLGSKISATGQTFRIALEEPLIFQGSELIPAGVSGIGEVIHAKKAGASGSGGELILAAKYLEFDGRQIPLRSMSLGVEGQDQTGLAMAVGMATGPFGFAVRGKNVDVTEGTLAMAKLAQDTELTPTKSETELPDECVGRGELEE